MTDETPLHSGVAAFWQTSGGEAWGKLQDLLDRLNAPFVEILAHAAGVAPGDRVLDVGCGGGATTLDFARRVGAAGHGVGIDISASLLKLARRRAQALDVANVDFIEGDAQTHSFEQGAFDAIVSRFGVMFFTAPDVAFANLGQALRPGGQLAFVCWRGPAENPLSQIPLQAAAPHLASLPPPPGDGPGRFAFADRDRVRGILERSGWRSVELAPLDTPTPLTLDELMALSVNLGALGPLLARESPATQARVREAVADALKPHVGADGLVQMTAACWLATARR
jgi:SAM-dependent methyltransferase